MNDDDSFDFSALDPMRDPERWQRVVAATRIRVEAALDRRPSDPLSAIAAWKRQLLIAAGIALVLIVPVEVALELREPEAEQVQRLVSLSIAGGRAEQPPSGAEFLRALAEEEGR
jgi:hypothetical protein